MSIKYENNKKNQFLERKGKGWQKLKRNSC